MKIQKDAGSEKRLFEMMQKVNSVGFNNKPKANKPKRINENFGFSDRMEISKSNELSSLSLHKSKYFSILISASFDELSL